MSNVPSSRRIDHLVLPAQDLEAQADFYRRLGFQVGARNRHPWGTENRLIQFDGSFLELITLGGEDLPPRHGLQQFSFGGHVQEWLATEGDGMSMLVLDSANAQEDARWFRQAGIGDSAPFSFARKARKMDGSETDVAFTLAFAAASSLPDLGFFVCEQHYPDNFWNLGLQVHENGATGIRRIVVVQENPQESLTFIKAFAGGHPHFEQNLGYSLKLQAGTISIWTPDGARAVLGDDPLLFQARRGRFGAVLFDVGNLERTELTLRKNNVPHRQERGRIVVPSGAAMGIMIIFEEKGRS
jgi:catechol 2,3-dioxygenase-like lactoylglutathione lyase family enzyme